MPFDALAQFEGQHLAILAPRPFGGEIGHDCIEAILRGLLVEHDQIVEHGHVGPSATMVDSSWIDIEAGLSPCGIFRIPPDFCAVAGPGIAASANAASAPARHHAFALSADIIRDPPPSRPQLCAARAAAPARSVSS